MLKNVHLFLMQLVTWLEMVINKVYSGQRLKTNALPYFGKHPRSGMRLFSTVSYCRHVLHGGYHKPIYIIADA